MTHDDDDPPAPDASFTITDEEAAALPEVAVAMVFAWTCAACGARMVNQPIAMTDAELREWLIEQGELDSWQETPTPEDHPRPLGAPPVVECTGCSARYRTTDED